ncbi:MAG: ATP-binding protein [Deltaproteobacteria bacterium]|jgi:two-component system NtrC family sensor kinase
MNESQTTDAEPIDQLKSEAQRALLERPLLSVRSRISLGFALWFILSLAITVGSIVIVSEIENKLYFMESAAKYIFEVQQARRFEKNFFLYRTNLDDSLKQVRLADTILEKNSEKMMAVVGKQSFDGMVHHINLYEELLIKLQKLDKRPTQNPPPNFNQIEDALREHGAKMVAAAENLLARERQSVNRMIYLSKRVPMLFLLFLLGLMIFSANFIARQMIRPLKVLMDATQRIANGDIATPIMPVRRYRDEFTELSLAMNSMMDQLAQRQEQLIKAHKLKAVGTLTAGVAHELNNPINNIMLTAAMLQEDYSEIDDTERLDMIKDLVDEADRAQKIIRNLLEFAREREIDTHLFQLDDILQESLQLVSNQLKLFNVKVERRFTPNLGPVSGDKQQLTQVFLNLALNAIDAMPNGGTLTIETDTIREGNFLKVDFTDSGTGIADHVKPHIFDPFFTSKSQGKGTGLGLSVSLGIIRKHGGDILVDSRINEGTTFSVLLPMAKIPS